MTKITVTDRNETKYLIAIGFKATSVPRGKFMLDFIFEASEKLFEARKDFSLNAAVPVISFISASREVDKQIADYKNGF